MTTISESIQASATKIEHVEVEGLDVKLLDRLGVERDLVREGLRRIVAKVGDERTGVSCRP